MPAVNEIVLKANAMRKEQYRPDKIRAFVFNQLTELGMSNGHVLTEVNNGQYWQMTLGSLKVTYDRHGYT